MTYFGTIMIVEKQKNIKDTFAQLESNYVVILLKTQIMG